MWPWRSLVPTTEMVTMRGRSVSEVAWPPSAARVVDATSDEQASAIAVRYNARMRLLWRGLAIVVMTAAAACGSGPGFRPDGGGTSGGGGSGGNGGNRWTGTVPATINRNVDILFLIDDSSDMRLAQTNLINNFPTF